MRITSGTHRGRVFDGPQDQAIRPTSDKVRQAVFNQIRSRMDCAGAIVLDAFAGTGALGLEALSNHAARALFMDRSPIARDLIQHNAFMLGLSEMCTVLDADAARPPRNQGPAAGLVFLDPPYGEGLIDKALQGLGTTGWIAPDSLIVCESETSWRAPASLHQKVYGDTKITLLDARAIL